MTSAEQEGRILTALVIPRGCVSHEGSRCAESTPMNPIILRLIATDFLALSGFGLVTPVFAIFIERNVAGGSLAVVGVAQMIYMVVKAVLQLAVGRFNDRDRAYLREYWTGLLGYSVLAIVPFLYLAVDSVRGLYAVQALFGVGAAFAYPGFMTIFTKFADAQREGTEWSIYSTSVFIGMAITAAVGGWLVEEFGFRPVFVGMGGIAVLGALAFASLGFRYRELHRDHRPAIRHHRDVMPVR